MTNLERYVVKEVDPVSFYSREIGYSGGGKTDCPFHKETKPSFEIRSSDGSGYCYGCRTYVSSIIIFYMLYHKVSKKRALFQIFDSHIEPIIRRSRYFKLIKRLRPGGKPWRFMINRGINEGTIRNHMIGFDGDRIIIPVFNEWGYCVNLRAYDYTGKDNNKMYSYKKGYGRTRLFPMTSLGENTITIFEGEMDVLLGLSHGLNAITLTGGAESWKYKFTKYFKNKNVVICMDNDKPGQKGAKLIGNDLKRVCNSLVNIVLPRKYGKDITDYISHKSFEDFKTLVHSSLQYKLDKKSNLDDDVYSTEKGMILTMDKDKETIHLIIKVEGKR